MSLPNNFFNLFLPNVSILYSLKTKDNQSFQGVRNEKIGKEWVTENFQLFEPPFIRTTFFYPPWKFV